jgi:hypothetical protein
MTAVPKKDCKHCGQEFQKSPTTSVADWFGSKRYPNGRLYCSALCSQQAQKGRRPPNKGIPGQPWSAERRAKQSATYAANYNPTRTHRWSGGKWGKLRQLVLLRDNYTCTSCRFRDPEIMNVDHDIPRAMAPELMYAADNCRTLCPNCHARKTIADKRLIAEQKAATSAQVTEIAIP